MRYQDYDSANDEYDIRYNISKTTRYQEQLIDDYEFLENYDFISHLESSGVLKQDKDTKGQNSDKQEIFIDLEFMQDPSFYKEIENITQLNNNLVDELVELDDTLSGQSNPPKRMYRTSHRRFGVAMVIYSLIAIIFMLAGGYFISLRIHENEDAYAFNNASTAEQRKVSGKENQKSGKAKPEVENQTVMDKTGKDIGKEPVKETENGPSSGNVAKGDTDSVAANEQKKDETENFDNVLFIGNSLVVGLMQNSKLPGAAFYACQSLNIKDAFNKTFVREKASNKKLTILEALHTKQYRKIYLMFGINELGWPYSNIFIEEYQKFIEEVRELQPEATIYVQSILPVAKSRSKKQPIFSKKNVVEHNSLIQEMCSSVGVNYVNVYKGLCDSKGYLPEEYSTDGIHLRVTGYEKWIEYLKEER